MPVDTIRFKRGVDANVNGLSLASGEPAWTTDTHKLFIGDGTNKVLVNASVIDDITLSALSTTQPPSENAVKRYVDNSITDIENTISTIQFNTPTKTSQLTNDSGFLTNSSNKTVDGGTF